MQVVKASGLSENEFASVKKITIPNPCKMKLVPQGPPALLRVYSSKAVLIGSTLEKELKIDFKEKGEYYLVYIPLIIHSKPHFHN